jgi:hypothetical protein
MGKRESRKMRKSRKVYWGGDPPNTENKPTPIVNDIYNHINIISTYIEISDIPQESQQQAEQQEITKYKAEESLKQINSYLEDKNKSSPPPPLPPPPTTGGRRRRRHSYGKKSRKNSL